MSTQPRERNCVNYDPEWSVCAQTKDGHKRFLSSRYGCSKHNCNCNKSKTGIVLYPCDTRYKNIILLMCEKCYGYKQGNGTQHQQIFNWYNQLYGKSKSFELVSGFAQDINGNLKYNSWTFNNHQIYGTGLRNMDNFEQKILQDVLKYKLSNYQVGKEPSNDLRTFKCSNGHSLKLCDNSQRLRDDGGKYPQEGFICDICEKTFLDSLSWHCSCSQNGFDKCCSCVAFNPQNTNIIMNEED